ncbi:MAG: hypothetical protein AAGI38_20810 [Bacteroidota bacterium]
MQKKPLFIRISFLLAVIACFLPGCGPSHPSEDEVRAKIVGTYCSEDYRLVLTDSTYKNVKYVPGILSDAIRRESCEGTYNLVFETDRWIIRFDADENASSLSNCKTEYTLWSQQDAYLIGEQEVTMRDLFDMAEVTVKGCEE